VQQRLKKTLQESPKHSKIKTMKLLSPNNTKIKKGEKLGWLTLGLSLSPYNLSGKNFCSHASSGCAAACLNTSGMGVFSNVQAARLKKSRYFIEQRDTFVAQLNKEIRSAIKSAKRKEMRLAVRLNVLSDLPWENLIDMKEFEDVTFYDYTPNPKRMIAHLQGELPKNYHLTFSRKENNQAMVELIAKMGGNIAAVFAGKLPETYLGKKVINGDDTDLRFLDDKGVIVGLVAKGKGKKDASGFVLQP
jgi:hypothetical protein